MVAQKLNRTGRRQTRRRSGWLVLWTLLFSQACYLPTTFAAEDEYAVKAAFLIHFMNYVTWPESSFEKPDTPINLCLVGGNPFGESIRPISRKTAQGRAIQLIEVPEGGNGTACQVVFISGNKEAVLRQLLAEWKATGVLTVGDGRKFIELGGIIEYVMVNNRVRFALNDEAAREAELQVSVKLRKVAMKQ